MGTETFWEDSVDTVLQPFNILVGGIVLSMVFLLFEKIRALGQQVKRSEGTVITKTATSASMIWHPNDIMLSYLDFRLIRTETECQF